MDNKESLLGVFTNMEGAIDKTTLTNIHSALIKRVVSPTISSWISNLFPKNLIQNPSGRHHSTKTGFPRLSTEKCSVTTYRTLFSTASLQRQMASQLCLVAKVYSVKKMHLTLKIIGNLCKDHDLTVNLRRMVLVTMKKQLGSLRASYHLDRHYAFLRKLNTCVTMQRQIGFNILTKE